MPFVAHSSVGRAPIILLALSSCARQNPAFDEQQDSAETGSSQGTDDAGASSLGPGGPGSGANSNSGTGASMDGTTGRGTESDSAGATTTLATSTGPGVADTGSVLPDAVKAFASEATSGAIAEAAADHWAVASGICASTQVELLPELACPNVWPMLPIDGVNMADIPARPGGEPLTMGEILAPDGTVVAESYTSLIGAEVTADFADAVTAHVTADGVDPSFWWGQQPNGALGDTCGNWSDAGALGVRLTFDAAAGAGPLGGTAPCAQLHHLMCLCF